MLKAVIIGAGFISEFHADAYSELGSVRLCAVCDTDERRAGAMAQKLSCKAYTDAKTMLEEIKPDIASICLPSFLHEEYAVLALSYGANVLCEKPLALSMESCERMAEAAAKNRRMLMTGQVLRWWPEYRTITEAIRRLGNPLSVATQRLQHASRTTWMADPNKGGGVLFDLFVHDLDYLCSLFGTKPEIEAVYGAKGPEGSWRGVCAMLRWDSGVCAKIEAGNRMPPCFPFTVDLRADYPQQCLQYHFRAPVNIQKDAATQAELLLYENGLVTSLDLPKGAQSMAFSAQIAAFVHGVEAGVNPLPVDDTLCVMRLIHRVKAMLEALPQA